ncbi:type VI secretion system-associated FHA domain protein TagH [Pseudomonas citrulli]|uniref:Type VI secretion system-associated FHA domain protein TagH n=1 Tax=Pseudomonas citrulli TaxID=3064347 RepID=A0ABT9BVS6_9PSED|nr:type VI secretion system-associated FHA domain protein TagH [Pseudomonas sp. K18]MDO7896641.1 type VI secretion system-associated FHA domain protein TagH [Pseudomonas sp. K18]
MELVFEMPDPGQSGAVRQCRKVFGPAGGAIGRGEDCDWIIPDRQRLVSKRHAVVSFREGAFYLTDISANGTIDRDSGLALPKGQPTRIRDASAYLMGGIEVLAHLVGGPARSIAEADHPMSGERLIPDDAFLDLDPLKALDQQERACLDIDRLIEPAARTRTGFASLDHALLAGENLLLPELAEAGTAFKRSPATQHPDEGFWARFGGALGVELDDLDPAARESLALTAARWFKQTAQAYEEQARLILPPSIDRHG